MKAMSMGGFALKGLVLLFSAAFVVGDGHDDMRNCEMVGVIFFNILGYLCINDFISF